MKLFLKQGMSQGKTLPPPPSIRIRCVAGSRSGGPPSSPLQPQYSAVQPLRLPADAKKFGLQNPNQGKMGYC